MYINIFWLVDLIFVFNVAAHTLAPFTSRAMLFVVMSSQNMAKLGIRRLVHIVGPAILIGHLFQSAFRSGKMT